ncbi:hypothetical protein QUA13_23725 [Microcoleus sp. S28C3]|uniref:hypothetical protein n=1 Tax=Microcoleus sp. S28C3 TaxID=3055414 RepID=UPI002FCF8F7B
MTPTAALATIDRPNLPTFPTLDNDPDVFAQLLADKRSINTKRAYAGDVRDFFRTITGQIWTSPIKMY